MKPYVCKAIMALIVATAFANQASAEWQSPRFGGTGGRPYNLHCGKDGVAIGVNVRAGSWIDNIELICAPVNGDGQLGDAYTAGSIGGQGGSVADTSWCPNGMVVGGMKVIHGTYVNAVTLVCFVWTVQ